MKVNEILLEANELAPQQVRQVMSDLHRLEQGDIDEYDMHTVSRDLLTDYALDVAGDDPRIHMSMKGRDADPSEWIHQIIEEPGFFADFEAWLHKSKS